MIKEELIEKVASICRESGIPSLNPDHDSSVISLCKCDRGLFFEENNILYARDELSSENYCRMGHMDDLETIISSYIASESVAFCFCFSTHAVRIFYFANNNDAEFALFDSRQKKWICEDITMEKMDDFQALIGVMETPFSILLPKN